MLTLPTRVFEETSTNFFQLGRLLTCLRGPAVGVPVVHHRMRYSTAREVAQAIISNFVDFGVLLRIQTDNGPQLSGSVFA